MPTTTQTMSHHARRDAKRASRRALLAGTLTSALIAGTLLSAGPVSAHATVELYGSEPVAGTYGHMFVRIPHGCDGARVTDTIIVEIPAGFTSVKPERKDGWKTRIGRNGKGRVTSITWYDGNLPDDHFEDFGISVKYPEKHGTYHLPTTQRCRRDRIAWNQVTKPVDNPHTLERPAPRVVVTKAVDEGGADGKGIGKGVEVRGTHRPDRRGEASVLSFNGRSTLIADLPATLRDRLATVTLESGTDPTQASATVLEKAILDEDGDLMRTYRNVDRDGGRWRIAAGDALVVSVAGEEIARAVVAAKK